MKNRKLTFEDFKGLEISKNKIKNIIGGVPVPGSGGVIYDSDGNPIQPKPGTGTGTGNTSPGTSDGDPTGGGTYFPIDPTGTV